MARSCFLWSDAFPGLGSSFWLAHSLRQQRKTAWMYKLNLLVQRVLATMPKPDLHRCRFLLHPFTTLIWFFGICRHLGISFIHQVYSAPQCALRQVPGGRYWWWSPQHKNGDPTIKVCILGLQLGHNPTGILDIS
jgi:hypothetical protein